MADEGEARWMAAAVEEARRAATEGEVPVGAVIVDAGAIIARDHNRTRQLADPTAHGEMLVLREAARQRGDWRLSGCMLYVTLEPCAMCAGAIVLARIDRLVFAAHDPKAGMCGSLGNIVQDDRLNHSVAVESGLLADESARLLQDFFQARR